VRNAIRLIRINNILQKKTKIMSKNDLISIRKALKEWSKIAIPFAIHLTIMAIIIYNYAKQ